MELSFGRPNKILYKNWKGVTAVRNIEPLRLWHGSTEFHKEPQWFVTALDYQKDMVRDFALLDITELNSEDEDGES